MQQHGTTRRDFISAAVAGGAALALHRATLAADSGTGAGGMPQRRFGNKDVNVSLLCVGGYHIGRPEEQESIRLIQEAVDNGATFMDNAWEYHDGGSEIRMGKALEGRRDKVFLMTKHHGRDKKTAMKHLEDSLKRLKTDYIDLWQFHEVVYEKDPEMIFAPGGGIEAADLAKKQGKARFIGFTGHKYPWIHLQMLAYGYPWDAVQMPLNPFDVHYNSFQQQVLPVLVHRGIACLAMKTRASGEIIKTGAATAEDLWRYVTALPVATVVSGMESRELLQKNLKMARELKPMDKQEMAAIEQKVAQYASTGQHEKYKISRAFDGPVGRQLHGIKQG